jgi:hypothetical protein
MQNDGSASTRVEKYVPLEIAEAGPGALAAWGDFVNDTSLQPVTRKYYRHQVTSFLRTLAPLEPLTQ